MKTLLRFGFASLLSLVGYSASAQCVIVACATNKTVECSSSWTFDPPIVNATGCSCGTNYTLSVVSTTTNAAGGVCFTKAEQVWLVVDCTGGGIFCTQDVSIVDTTPPSVVCAPDKTVLCTAAWTFDPPTSIVDACCATNSVTQVGTQTNAGPGGCGLVASTAWVIRDCCGNTTNCAQHVTILPGPPVITCTNYTIPCSGPIPVPPTPPGATSSCCSAVQVSLMGSSTNFAGCAGSVTFLWKAVNCCGSSTLCTQVVSFVPSPPILLCSTVPTVIQCGSPIPTNPPLVIDLCCSNTIPIPLGGFVTSTIPGTVCGQQLDQAWIATNCCGGGSTICTQSMYMFRTNPPSLTCATNKTVQCGSGWTFDPPTVFGLCCTNIFLGLTTNAYPTPLVCQTLWEGVWLARDCCSNVSVCTQQVIEVDTQPPIVTCAPNKTVQCGTTWIFDSPTGYDLCCGTNIFIITNPPTVLTQTTCLIVYSADWKITDCCGNSTTCTQIVTQVNTLAPSITCAPNKTVQCGTNWTFDPPTGFSSGCCAGTPLNFQLLSSNVVSSSTCSSVYSGVWRASDCCSNIATCTQLVTVVDTTPPTISCPSNFTVAPGNSWNFGIPTATDACCGTNVTIIIQSTVTSSICPLIATRTWRAVDCCTNFSAPCSQTVNVQCSPPPQNDQCSNAIPVFAGSPAFCGSTKCATPSAPGSIPPPCGASANSPDVWFTYRPLCNGPVTIDTCGNCPGFGTFDTVLSVYTGTCGALSTVACNNNAGGACGIQSSVTFYGFAGVTYHLRVSGPNCASGDFRLNITASSTPPPNDLCQNAIVVSNGSPAACGTTMCATPSSTGSIPFPCGSSFNSPDVWYVWTPTCTGPVTIDTCGLCPGQTTNFNTVLSVYTGTCGALWTVACNDNAGGSCGVQSRVTFTAVAGVKYFIRVAGFDTIWAGPFRLNIVQTITPPPNNPCASPITIGPSGMANFSTCGATTDGPTQPGCQPDCDVWFRWKAPCAGLVSVDTCVANFNTVVSVYTGPCGGLSLVACNDDAGPNGPCPGSQSSFLTFNAVAGTVYTIRIGGVGCAQGWGVVRVLGPYPPLPTCPPPSGPFFCRVFQVLGTANNTPWAWNIRSACCFNFGNTNVPGLPTGSSAAALAAAFAASINNVCTNGSVIAFPFNVFPWTNCFAVCITSCSNPPVPWTFSVGPAGTPASNQCIVANIGTPIFPPAPLPTTGPCSFNPEIIELPYANADLNGNGIDDALDIMSGTSADLNGNGIPDEVEDCQIPQVLTEPESQQVTLGTDVSLDVTTSGSGPIGYQWSFNGAPLGGQTSSSLLLSSISAAQLGDYTLSITNPCGTNGVGPVTLATEPVEPLTAPIIRTMDYQNGTFTVTFATEDGQSYAVDYKNNLTDPSWTALGTNVGDGFEQTVTNNPPLPNSRFYRVRLITP